jgi:hypothetical protein
VAYQRFLSSLWDLIFLGDVDPSDESLGYFLSPSRAAECDNLALNPSRRLAAIAWMPLNSALWFILSTIVGGGVFCAFIWQHFAKARARMVELEIRPPQVGAILRPPGHSLTESLFQLVEEQDQKIATAILAAIFAAAMLYPVTALASVVAGAPEVLSDIKVRWIAVGAVLGFVATALSVYRAFLGFKEILTLKREMKNLRMGLRGEQAVAEILHCSDVAGAGYVSFHDVPKDGGGNIDHIAIGPGGVFVIETKMRSQRKPEPQKKRNRLWFDGTKTDFPSGNYDYKATQQVAQNGEMVAKWIRSMAPNAPIESLLVYPGWEVHQTQRCEDVKAMSTGQLRHYFRDLASALKPDEQAAIRAMLDKRCRDVRI